jgi:hypothetical protein
MSNRDIARYQRATSPFPPISRRTAREIEEVRQQGVVGRYIIEGQEDGRAYRLDRRLTNAYQIGERVVMRDSNFRAMVRDLAYDDPEAARVGAEIADTILRGAKMGLYDYLRPM